MIKITKTAPPPTILTVRGTIEESALCAKYISNPLVYCVKYNKATNPHKLTINKSIYGHVTVKNQLIIDQHGKCCFCESLFLATGYGDVEHYRPKGGYQQNTGDTLGKPGYYWLAYRWENLLLSCEICNRKHKKNLFPITLGTARALMHSDPLESASNCLLINPNSEDPMLDIIFNSEVPVGRNARGRRSIVVYGLKRQKLNELRATHLQNVRANIIVAEIDLADLPVAKLALIKSSLGVSSDAAVRDLIRVASTYINNSSKDAAPYANMIRHHFPHLPRT